MNVNLNYYDYSYTNYISSSLKKPLFEVISKSFFISRKPHENLALYVAKVASRVFYSIIFCIPAGISWLVGKSIYYLGSTQIDKQGLSLAPPKIDELQDYDVNQEIDISILSKKFDTFKYAAKPGELNKKECLSRLCSWTLKEDDRLYPDDPTLRKMFYKELSIFLKGLAKKIEAEDLSKDKEKDILMELAEASTRCYPTWLEVASKLFLEVSGKSETVEVKLLRHLQEYKETIALEFVQGTLNLQWHGLTTFRNILGQELGLNTNLNNLDPYGETDVSEIEKSFCKWFFMQKYEDVNRLTTGIQNRINSKDYDVAYYNFLVEIMEQKGVEDPKEFVGNHFYIENEKTRDYELTQSAVNLMLRCIGVLK